MCHPRHPAAVLRVLDKPGLDDREKGRVDLANVPVLLLLPTNHRNNPSKVKKRK